MAEYARLDNLPTELLLDIAGYLDIAGLNSLLQTTISFHAILSQQLCCRGATHVGKTTPLIWAVKKGRNSAVSRLLDAGADPCALVNMTTPFHIAFICFNTKALDLLLTRVPTPSILNASGQTPLQLAVYQRRIVLLRKLLYRLSPGSGDDGWEGALEVAVSRRHIAAVRYLLQNPPTAGASPFQSRRPPIITQPALEGDHIMVELLRDFGWNDWDMMGPDGTRPLHVAAGQGNLEMVRQLLQYGANIDGTDYRGWTPLHAAISAKHVEMVQLLLEVGADVNAAAMDGNTVLHLSVHGGSIPLSEILLNASADVNAQNQFSITPLHNALSGGYVILTNILIARRADFTSTDISGYSPLHKAVQSGLDKWVHLLLSSCALVAADKEGATPPMLAVHMRRVRFIKPLVRAGFNVSNGLWWPLRSAIRCDSISGVQALISCGADVNYMDQVLGSPLEEALSLQAPAVLDVLVKAGADISKTSSGLPIVHAALNGWLALLSSTRLYVTEPTFML